MALARIITRSEACSRELAILLQSRGYAVETVSPDNVPTNAADLELRVDTGSGDCLTASVVARDGDRSSTLKFVRQLKSPITASTADELPEKDVPRVEILARPVVKSAAERLDGRQRDRNVESALPVSSPKEAPRALEPKPHFASAQSQIASPVTPPLTRWRPIGPVEPQSLLPTRIEPGVADAKPVVVPAISTLAPTVPATEPAVPIVASANPAAPVEEVGPVVPEDFPYQTFDHAPALFGNVALVLTSMALLITLAVGFSLYRSKKSLSNTDKVAPPSATSTSDTKDPGNHSAGGSPSKGAPAVKPATKSVPAGKPAPATKAVGEITKANRPPVSASHRVGPSGGDEDDLVAKDTVIYFERRPKTASKPSASSSRSRSHRDGAIAENTVTYLNGMTGASKPAK